MDAPVANTGEDAKCSSETTLCVDPEKIFDQIKSRMGKCKEKRNKQNKEKGEMIKEKGKKMKDFVKGMKKDDKGKRGKKFDNEVSSDVDTKIELINEKCTESECQDLQKKMEDSDANKDCFKAIGQLMVGSFCGLLGENGSENAEVDSTGNIVNFKINKESAVAVFEKCAEYFQTQCVLSATMEIAEEVSTGKKPVKKGKGKRIQEACNNVTDISTCLDDVTKCNEDLKVEFIQGFISLGKSCAPGEDKEDMDKGAQDLDTLADAPENTETTPNRLLSEFGARLLEEEVTSDCEIQVTSNGYNSFSAGASSGYDFDEFSESGFIVLSTLIVSYLSFIA